MSTFRSGNVQLKLLNNAWCFNCRKTTGIGGEVTGKVPPVLPKPEGFRVKASEGGHRLSSAEVKS